MDAVQLRIFILYIIINKKKTGPEGVLLKNVRTNIFLEKLPLIIK